MEKFTFINTVGLMKKMETDIHSRLLSPPVFAFPRKMSIVSHFRPWEVTFYRAGDYGLASGREFASAGLESFTRQMIAQFALDMLVPVLRGSPLNKAHIIKRKMSPSLKKRLILVDRRGNLWKAIQTFMQPIRQDIGIDTLHGDSSAHGKLSQLSWSVYVLILGNRTGADVPVNPRQQGQLAGRP